MTQHTLVFQLALTIFLILTAIVIYYLLIRPRKIMNFYKKQLSTMNYRVKVKPFQFFYNGVDGDSKKGKKDGDPFRLYRTEYPNYDIVLSNSLCVPIVQLVSVDFIKDYFTLDKHYDYPKMHLFMNPFKRFYGDLSIGMSQGEIWKQRRAILNKLFNFQFVKLQIPTIVKIADTFIAQMQKNNKAQQTEQGKLIQPYIYEQLSLHIFSQVLFYLSLGLKQRHQVQGVQVAQYMAETVKLISNNQIGSPTSFVGNWFYNLEIRKIDKIINHRIKVLKQWGYKIIKQKLVQAEKELKQNPETFVADSIVKAIVLYKKQYNLSDDDTYVSVQYLFSQICGLFVAGTDTTSNFWNMMIAYIGKYPQIQQKVRQEVDLYMKNNDYSYQNLKKMTYIDALQKEVTRVYGPGNLTFPRIAIRDNYINGLGIKKGTILLVNPIGNEYSEKYFKQPLQFRPQRWLNGECENLTPYVLLGFHAGARTCIGKQFALLQSKIALIKFIKRYKKITIPNKDFKMNYNLTLCAQYFKTKLLINE